MRSSALYSYLKRDQSCTTLLPSQSSLRAFRMLVTRHNSHFECMRVYLDNQDLFLHARDSCKRRNRPALPFEYRPSEMGNMLVCAIFHNIIPQITRVSTLEADIDRYLPRKAKSRHPITHWVAIYMANIKLIDEIWEGRATICPAIKFEDGTAQNVD
ncbi:hypothetical protein DL93DRAFT_856813 [Clavulina sp. PMI_390]|nr:hypothetical protein DL93DRAFT_856813 [Clavulina sp. PMI_390]